MQSTARTGLKNVIFFAFEYVRIVWHVIIPFFTIQCSAD